MIKKFFLVGILVGNSILFLTYIFIKYLPESGPFSIFSKMYHLSRLVGGSVWNDLITAHMQTSATFMKIYTVGYYVVIYSIIYGILGFASGVIGKLFTRTAN